MNQQYMYFFLETANNKEACLSLIKKMSTTGGPGAIIAVTSDEFGVLENMITVPIGPPAPEELCPHGISMNISCAKCNRFGKAL